jgi:hypothetical protein
LTAAQKRARRARRARALAESPLHAEEGFNYFEATHPAFSSSVASLTPLPPPPPSSLSLATLTHVQRLLTVLAHSPAAALYAKPLVVSKVGGLAAATAAGAAQHSIKELQAVLAALTNQAIQGQA